MAMASLAHVKIGVCSSPSSSLLPPTSAQPLPRVAAHVGPNSTSSFQGELARSGFSRRLLALLASLPLQDLLAPWHQPAMAFSLGISGPKEWLKGQKKKTAEFLLAPINMSRERLKSAFSLAETTSPSAIEEALKLVKSAARDCIKPEDGSLVAFQAKTGVEVCTFRLILKNAASLIDDGDPVKLNANVALDNLISSFTSLDGILTDFPVDGSSNRNIMADAFSQTSSALDNFEKGVRECLGIS